MWKISMMLWASLILAACQSTAHQLEPKSCTALQSRFISDDGRSFEITSNESGEIVESHSLSIGRESQYSFLLGKQRQNGSICLGDSVGYCVLAGVSGCQVSIFDGNKERRGRCLINAEVLGDLQQLVLVVVPQDENDPARTGPYLNVIQYDRYGRLQSKSVVADDGDVRWTWDPTSDPLTLGDIMCQAVE